MAAQIHFISGIVLLIGMGPFSSVVLNCVVVVPVVAPASGCAFLASELSAVFQVGRKEVAGLMHSAEHAAHVVKHEVVFLLVLKLVLWHG